MSRLMLELKVLRALIRRRVYISPRRRDEIIDAFHRLFYDSWAFDQTWAAAEWLGTRIFKCPLDLFVYQEMIHEIRPDVIVETGTACGGSALFLASMFDLVGNGRVITIDTLSRERPKHDRVTYLLGSSTSAEIQAEVERRIGPTDQVMVILDSDHSAQHVLAELRAYSKHVSVGSYLVVEDTNVNGHPVEPDFGPGPAEAIGAFLKESNVFVVDRAREKFLLSFNPGGYLRRVR